MKAGFSGPITPPGNSHNWGSQHTDRYAWAQVCGFDSAPDVFLECAKTCLNSKGFGAQMGHGPGGLRVSPNVTKSVANRWFNS
jgi:hypothetical protein